MSGSGSVGVPRVRVSADRCVGCGDCLDPCPTGALVLPSGEVVVRVDERFCTGCRRCVEVCPNRAVTVTGPKQPITVMLERIRESGAADGCATASPRTGQPGPVPGGTAVLGRRRFLTGAGLVGGGLAAGTVLGAAVAGPASGATGGTASGGVPGRLAAVPFHGVHQAGILTPAPAAAAYAVFDVTAGDVGELTALMLSLTAVARQVTAGGALPDAGITAPPADNGLLGPEPSADGVTVTVAVGASLFDERFGLTDRIPRHLTAMPPFAGDEPDPAQTHGDLLVQIRAGHRDTVLRALRLITRATRGALLLRYRIEGFIPPPAPSGTPRDLFGFRHGIAGPDLSVAGTADRLVWAGPDEPGWAAGGTYQVLRIIRMFVESWDRLPLAAQEAAIGRRKDSGAPLDGRSETDQPRYVNDPEGSVIPLTAHIRHANPRTGGTEDSRFLRVGYSYDRGVDPTGDLDQGLVLTAFQQDVGRQFATVQQRLAGEPLADYVRACGGGYFFALPGVRDPADRYARALLG